MRKITIKSTLPFTDKQKAKLEEGLKPRYNGEELAFIYELDEKLIGGIVIEDGESVVDASISKSLKEFKRHSESYIGSNLSDEGELPSRWKYTLFNGIDFESEKVESGRVVESADGIVTVENLSDCRYYELLKIGEDDYAIAMNLMEKSVKAMLITGNEGIEYGSVVRCTGKIVEVPVGNNLLGRVITPLGQPLDGKGELRIEKVRPIESPAPMIIDRAKVSRPLLTGILSIDGMIPIGKGQRELIIGDRQTGKSSIAIDAIINQRDKDVICIYVAIGQRAGSVSKLIKKLNEAGAMKNSVVVVSTADDNAALQYIAPYTGCAIAEEFMSKGKDVLIVYDDLSKHANAYRSISLLLKRPSGREAYPGDVFYIHSRLLERSAQLSEEKGGGSITAIPIIETQAGDISQYIPTNVISITDGQIYLESELFHAGVRPAVNVGLSVSRVGGSAQYPAIRKLASKLRLDLAHYRELALFTQFGAEVDEDTKNTLLQGEKVTEILKQDEGDPMSVDREIIILYLVNEKLERVPLKRVKEYVNGFYRFLVNSDYALLKELRQTGKISEENKISLDNAAANYEAWFFMNRE